MPVQMRGKRVGVEKLGKSSSDPKSLFAMPEDTSAVGIIRYVGSDLKDPDLKVGTKVYFGDQRQQMKIHGIDILVMEETNVLAVAQDDT
jgi:hypothetical protein